MASRGNDSISCGQHPTEPGSTTGLDKDEEATGRLPRGVDGHGAVIRWQLAQDVRHRDDIGGHVPVRNLGNLPLGCSERFIMTRPCQAAPQGKRARLSIH